MGKLMMLSTTVTCDEHEDAVIVYRASRAGCPMCEIEASLENTRQTIAELNEEIQSHAERLARTSGRRKGPPHPLDGGNHQLSVPGAVAPPQNANAPGAKR
jgi:hypothetical protein